MMLSPSLAVNLPRISTKKLPTKNKSKPLKSELTAFNIPPAVRRKKVQTVDIYFEAKKKALAHRLPVLSSEEIKRLRLPYKEYLLEKLQEKNYTELAHELELILRKEELALLACDDPTVVHKLSSDEELLKYCTEKLQLCSELLQRGKYEMAYNVRKALAEEFLKKGDKLWLVKHLYKTCIDIIHKIEKDEPRWMLESETKCILGYLELDEAETSDSALRNSTIFLEQARELSRGHRWDFKSKVVQLKLKRPVCLYGLRQDFELIHCRTMNIYDMASLLLYKSLSIKSSTAIFGVLPSPHALDMAHDNAKQALQLAEDVGNPTAINSSYMLLGALHLQRGDLELALDFFKKLQKNAEFHQDHDSAAVAFNMIGCTYMGLKDSVNALENFVCQKEIGDDYRTLDLQMDALQNIGFLLLEEGQLVEAEECLSLVVQTLEKIDPSLLVDPEKTSNNSWVMFAISAGMNSWSRLAGHCRRNQQEDLTIVSKWKGYRRRMDELEPPVLPIQHVQDTFPQYKPFGKFLNISPSQADSFLMTNKKLIDGLAEDKVPFDAHSSSSVADMMAQNRLKIQMATAREPRIRFQERFDKGQRVLYDSDLRENVKRVGRKYQQGESVYTLMPINDISSDSDSVIAVAEDESGTLIQKVSHLERDNLMRKDKRHTVLPQSFFSTKEKSRGLMEIKSSGNTARKLAQESAMSKTVLQGAMTMDRGSLWRISQRTLYSMNRYNNSFKSSKPLIEIKLHVPTEPEVVSN